MATYYQTSLFPCIYSQVVPLGKFKGDILSDGLFESCVREGVVAGCNKTSDKFRDGANSLSAVSHCRHEDVYNAIIDLLLGKYPTSDLTFVPNKSGTERLFFVFKGYMFIIRAVDGAKNDTNVEKRLRNQQLDKPVISIVYSMDQMKENVNSISLQYILGKKVLWAYDISVSADTTALIGENAYIDSAYDIPREKPRLKKNIKVKVSNDEI